jgi:uncharacterized integral membrane protein
MATFYLILALVISTIAVIFALQNTMLVTISFLSWTISGSLSLVLLATLAIGVLIGLLVLTPSVLKKTIKISSQRKRINALENEVNEHKAKVAEFQKPVPSVSLPDSNHPSQSPDE